MRDERAMRDERREFSDERGAAAEAYDALCAVLSGEGVDRDCDMASAALSRLDVLDETLIEVRDVLDDLAARAVSADDVMLSVKAYDATAILELIADHKGKARAAILRAEGK